MQTIYFAWHEISDQFVEVPKETFTKVQTVPLEGYINHTIIASKESNDDTSFWMFDVELGGAMGRVIAGVVKVVKILQGELLID